MDLVAGVVASLLAVLLVETYRISHRHIHERWLRLVLGCRSSTCSVIAPVYDRTSEGELIPHEDAYAIGHLMELCHRIGVETSIVPCLRHNETSEPGDIIVVGGPVPNTFTQSYLSRFLPSLVVIREGDVLAADPNGTGSGPEVRATSRGFQVGSVFLAQTQDEEHVILLKLNAVRLDQPRTVHVLFGFSGLGTAAAGYYLCRNYRVLARAFRGKSYCVAVRVSRLEGYKSVSTTFHDLSCEIAETARSAN